MINLTFSFEKEELTNIGIDQWISDHYPTAEKSINQCSIAVRAMNDHFEGLTIQVGLLNGIEHCWLIDDKGTIIDPTIKQFQEKDRNYIKISDEFLTKS